MGLKFSARHLITDTNLRKKMFHFFLKAPKIYIFGLFLLLPNCFQRMDYLPPQGQIIPGKVARPVKYDHMKVTGWFTSASQYFRNESEVLVFMEKANTLGLKKIYVSVWSRGCTPYPSQVIPSFGGLARCEGFDWLSPMNREAKKHGIKLIPWLEWGLHIPEDSKLIQFGKISTVEPETWHGVKAPRIDPFHSRNQSFLSALIFETAKFFGSSEVHLCDNQALMMSQLNKLGKTAQDFTDAFGAMVQRSREEGINITASVLEKDAALYSHGSDWTTWKAAGLIHEITAELYHMRSNPSKFAVVARAQAEAGADFIGIYAGAAGGWDDKQIIEFAQSSFREGLGVSIFELGFFLKAKTLEDVDQMRLKFIQAQSQFKYPQ